MCENSRSILEIPSRPGTPFFSNSTSTSISLSCRKSFLRTEPKTIEALLDMGNHVTADDGLGGVDWYSDVPRIFLEKGLISSELSQKWIRMIGFRNALVHGYMDVDRTIVYEVLQNGLCDIEELKRVFARHL